jgi:hypothetical protein
MRLNADRLVIDEPELVGHASTNLALFVQQLNAEIFNGVARSD